VRERAFASPNPLLCGVGKLPASLEFQNCHKVFGVYDRFIFRALVVSQQTLVGEFRKRIDPCLQSGGNIQCEDTAGGFGVQAAAERIEKLIEHCGGAHVFALARQCLGNDLLPGFIHSTKPCEGQ
jgi:hypothetical protein